MKRIKSLLLAGTLPVMITAVLALLSFVPKHPQSLKADSKGLFKTFSETPKSPVEIADCCDWAITNITISISGGYVQFTQLAHSYTLTGTVPWTTLHQIGTFAIGYRPTGTRTFTATGGGATFSCTVYSTGALWVQQTGGATLGRGVSIAGQFCQGTCS